MTVAELIKALEGAPPELIVKAWDGDFQHPVPVIIVHIDNDGVWLETSIRDE